MYEEELENDELFSFGMRKSGDDKITFRNVLYNVVMNCLYRHGKFSSKYAVEALSKSVYFNEPGVKLKDAIDKINQELLNEMKTMIQDEKKLLGMEIYGNAEKAKMKIKLKKYYYNELFSRLYQELTDHNMIIDTKKMTKIRIKKPPIINTDNDMNVRESKFKVNVRHS